MWLIWASLVALAEGLGFNPWVRKIPWKRKWQPIQYSCPGNPMDKGAWWATVHRGTKESDTT